MQIIGLAGAARSGKDTVARHLVKAHGFQQFSFSDALYREVSEAFGVSIEFLQDHARKESPTERLGLAKCRDYEFVLVACRILDGATGHGFETENEKRNVFLRYLSPRWVLQTWGTEYRRAQDPDYWIARAAEWVIDRMNEAGVEVNRLKLVNTSVRYPNEAAWVRNVLLGQVWHLQRRDRPEVRAHSSEIPLPVYGNDTVIHNNGSINSLWTAVTMKLAHPNVREIAVEDEETTG